MDLHKASRRIPYQMSSFPCATDAVMSMSPSGRYLEKETNQGSGERGGVEERNKVRDHPSCVFFSSPLLFFFPQKKIK